MSGQEHILGHIYAPEQTKISATALHSIRHLEPIKKMMKGDCDCSEVLIQLAAVGFAIRSTSHQILRNRMEACVTATIQQNDAAMLSELCRAFDEPVKWPVKAPILR